MSQLTAGDIMTTSPVTVDPNQTIVELVALFRKNLISGAPVVNANGILVGVVTLRDVAFTGLRGDQEPGYFVGADHRQEEMELTWNLDPMTPVEKIMTPMVFRVDIDTPVEKVADKMLRGKIHRMMVISNEKLVGVVTCSDMLKVVRVAAEKAEAV